METVYKIVINDEIRYIGRTKNIKKREYQHNYSFKTDKDKIFYKWLHSINYTDKIILEPIFKTSNKVESKRYELYLILDYYFKDKTQLKQRIPNISDKPF